MRNRLLITAAIITTVDAIRRATEDAATAVSGDVAGLYRSNPAPTTLAIETAILRRQDSNMVGVEMNAAGKPVDLYGTPFRVGHAVIGKRHIVTVISAGPDRLFDTPDDIGRNAAWESPDSDE